MHLKHTLLHHLPITFSTGLCIILSLALTAQQQHISGKGTSNFGNVKNARMPKKLPSDQPVGQNGFNPFKKNIPPKESGDNFFKRNGNSPVNPLDSNNISIEFYTCSDYYSGASSHAANESILFNAFFMTAYPIDSNGITVTIDFGDGTSATFFPNYYYYYYDSSFFDSTMFAVLALHSYSSAGSFLPSCTVVTAMGDTSTQTYFQPITITSASPAPPSITLFDVYSNQYCWNDSAYYYGNYWGDSLYYYGTYFSINLFYPTLQSLAENFTVNINYGDGSDTTFLYSYYNQNLYWYWWWGYYCPPNFYIDYSTHVYTQSGAYNILCTVTFPDGSVDTASATTYIADHCVTVGGKVFIDNNSNCIADSNEAGVPWVWLYIPYNYDSVYYYDDCSYYYYNYAITDSFGNYRFSFPDNCSNINDTIKFDPYYNFYPVVNLPLSCPSSGYYVFNSGTSQLDYDFGLGCTAGYDLQGFLSGWRFRPGFQGYLYPFFGNYQCDSISGTAKLIIDNPGFLTIDSVEPPASSIIGDTIQWNFSDLSLIDWWNYTTVYISTDTSATDGDTIHTTLILEPINGDSNPSNNIILQDFIVSNSWDPNEKEVFP